MHPDLAAYLAPLFPVASERAVWLEGRADLRIATYLTDAPPPLPFVTSVRAVICSGAAVLVVREADGGHHILPGGRREPGETLEGTLRREVLEETGWTLRDLALLGVAHFHNISPALPEFAAGPYPDFVQVIYRAEAGPQHPEARRPEDAAMTSTFLPPAEAASLLTSPGHRALLAAVARRS